MEFVLWGRRGSPLVPAHDVASSSWHKLLMDISAAARWGGGGGGDNRNRGGGRSWWRPVRRGLLSHDLVIEGFVSLKFSHFLFVSTSLSAVNSLSFFLLSCFRPLLSFLFHPPFPFIYLLPPLLQPRSRREGWESGGRRPVPSGSCFLADVRNPWADIM